MKQISATEAIQRMRALRHDETKHFIVHHITWDDTKQKTNGLRIVKKCRLRPSLPKELYGKPSDLYLPYYDIEKQKNGNCRKRLIRVVAFPPDFELLKVNWYD